MDDSARFVVFDPAHLITLGVIAVTAILVPVLVRRFSGQAQRYTACTLAAVLLAFEISKVAVRIVVIGDPPNESLPLHLCDFAAFLSAWALWKRHYGSYEIAYFWGLAGSVPAMLTPDLPHPFPHPGYIFFFTGHGLIVVGVLYATLVYGFRPRPASIGKTILATLALMAVILPINLLLGANYLYLTAPPAAATLIDYLGPWPWYIAGMFAIGIALCLLCYLPFAFLRKRPD